MARQKLGDRNIRKLSKAGQTSVYVTLPVEYVRELGWRTHQKLVVEKKGETLVIKDWKK